MKRRRQQRLGEDDSRTRRGPAASAPLPESRLRWRDPEWSALRVRAFPVARFPTASQPRSTAAARGADENAGITSRANRRRLSSTCSLGEHVGHVEDEVDLVDADRLPAPRRLADLTRIADADPFRRSHFVAGAAALAARRRVEVPERLIGVGRIRLAGEQQVAVEQPEHAHEAHAVAHRGPGVLVAVEEVVGRHAVVDHAADRLALAHAAVVLAGAALLLGVAHGGDAEAAEAAVGGVELGAGAGHRHPHRRMRLLQRLRQHRALGHREAGAVPRQAILHPHPRQHAHVLVPVLLGRVGIGLEAAELGPGRRARGAELEPAAREDVEERRALGHADRVVHLGHADHGAVAEADPLGLARGRGQEQLGRRAVRVLLEEVVLDRPRASRIRASRRGGSARARPRTPAAPPPARTAAAPRARRRCRTARRWIPMASWFALIREPSMTRAGAPSGRYHLVRSVVDAHYLASRSVLDLGRQPRHGRVPRPSPQPPAPDEATPEPVPTDAAPPGEPIDPPELEPPSRPDDPDVPTPDPSAPCCYTNPSGAGSARCGRRATRPAPRSSSTSTTRGAWARPTATRPTSGAGGSRRPCE